jgi:hypothetical protein
VADSRLNLGIKAALFHRRGIPGLYISHDMFHASPWLAPKNSLNLKVLRNP